MYRGASRGRYEEDTERDVMQRASQIVMKNKSFRPRERAKKGLKNLQSVKTLAGRTGSAGASTAGKARKQPLTVAAQFQNSLHALMDTLNQANPFFIRCIKSNSDKIPNVFNEETVQRQLRYTGMLETVRIRQAGYNVRLSYDEFIQVYRILLPKGLLSSQADVRDFLAKLNLNRDDYQLGATKIFMRESEQTKLDFKLHKQIMASIIAIQRWFRALLERRRFLAMRRASVLIQANVRQWLQLRKECAMIVQAWYRGTRVRRWYLRLRSATIAFQAAARGYLLRDRLPRIRRRANSLADKMDKPGPHAARITNAADYSKRPTDYSTHQSLEQLRDLINDKLNMLLEDEEAEKARQLRATQSLPLQRLEKKRENSLDGQPALTYCKRKVTKTQNINEMQVKQPSISTIRHLDSDLLEEPWSLSAAHLGKPSAVAAEKITPQQLASELKFLRIDQNNLKGDKNKTMEKEGDWSTTSSEEFLSPNHNWRGSDVLHSTDSASAISSRKSSPQSYQRSLSTTMLEPSGGSLLSIPPVRRDPRQYSNSNSTNTQVHGSRVVDVAAVHGRTATTVPEPPARTVRRTQRRQLEEVDSVTHDTQRTSDRVPDLDASISKRVSATSPLDPALRRRNSDPAATRLPAPRYPRSDPRAEDFIGSTGNGIFKIAGHRFRKVSRFAKGDTCTFCSEPLDAFVTPGQKCLECKQLSHTKCIQNKRVMDLPCTPAPLGGRRKHRKPAHCASEAAKANKFSLTGTSEFTDRTDKIISDGDELKQMQAFIAKKIGHMESTENKKQSEVDRVFKHALREFKDNLVETYSVVETRGSALKYKDLIANFLHVMETVCQREGSTFPITMGVNAFRGFMDEFMNEQHDMDKTRTKRKKDKKRKVDDPIQFAGHTFNLTMINIPTECEICKTFFMWPIERSLICQTCKLASHKKCYMKVSTYCRKDMITPSAAIVGALPAGARSHLPPGVLARRGKVFGVPLHLLPTGGGNIPIVIDRLITTVEMTGLYTEGIYRKSGVSSKVQELKRLLDENPERGVECLDVYAVHVRASVLKSWFRELPEPLLTFELYDDLILAAQLSDPQDRVATLFAILKKLPKPNYDLVERLIFHLARVALREGHNRMGANALAIVFAPCILRTSKIQPAQASLHDIALQTLCVETVLQEKIAEVRATLEDISTLAEACDTAAHRLSSIRSQKETADDKRSRPAPPEEEALLVTHIDEIEREKAQLTNQLPALITRSTSEDDLLSTDLDGESGSLDDLCHSLTPRGLRAQRQLHRQVSSDDPIMV